ncbi:hypothetical protein [Pseudomonas abietaniphila]|uniref:hypothetical protein n=1 Tax=Pseudomonas abietaniphila TaxID=89065 RepID=UPI00115FEB0C|nr:hypothetical protein [Pseudomonas abietaniphila]
MRMTLWEILWFSKQGCLSACVTFRMTQSVIECVTTRSVGTISDGHSGGLVSPSTADLYAVAAFSAQFWCGRLTGGFQPDEQMVSPAHKALSSGIHLLFIQRTRSLDPSKFTLRHGDLFNC